jgi:hypothetical protein
VRVPTSLFATVSDVAVRDYSASQLTVVVVGNDVVVLNG